MAVVTTVAGASSNSYLDVAGADALAASELGNNARAWASLTIEDKEAALMRATAEIDEFVGAGLPSYTQGQALVFPRAGDVVIGTYTPEIPVRVKRATFLQAAYLAANADLLDEAASRRARGLVNFSNPDGTGGTISEKRDFGRLYPRAEALVADVAGGAVVGWIVTT